MVRSLVFLWQLAFAREASDVGKGNPATNLFLPTAAVKPAGYIFRVVEEMQLLQLRELLRTLRVGQSAAFSSLSISSRLRVRSVEALGRKREVPSHVS